MGSGVTEEDGVQGRRGGWGPEWQRRMGSRVPESGVAGEGT